MFCQCQSIARLIVICIYSYLIKYSCRLSDYKTCSLRIIIVICVTFFVLSVCKGMSLDSVLRLKIGTQHKCLIFHYNDVFSGQSSAKVTFIPEIVLDMTTHYISSNSNNRIPFYASKCN